MNNNYLLTDSSDVYDTGLAGYDKNNNGEEVQEFTNETHESISDVSDVSVSECEGLIPSDKLSIPRF